jgi:cytochrome c5
VNLITKMLAAPVAAMALWAMSAQAATNDEIAERIKPVGQVCVQGEECKGIEVVASAGGGGAMTADDVVNKFCSTCHGAAAAAMGAPAKGDTAAWKARADASGGLDGLLANAISGIRMMPPKGTCATCSDDDLKGAIQVMSGL